LLLLLLLLLLLRRPLAGAHAACHVARDHGSA
jgi:hypothetical protein